MVHALSGGQRSVSELAQPFAMSLAAASKHVKVLEQAGLIQRSIQGRTHLCTLNPTPLAEGRAWLSAYERFWSERLDALDALFSPETEIDDNADH